jgi:hypothetical protein
MSGAVRASRRRSDETALKQRVEHVRDIVDELRDRAEMAFHERPYLLPIATGALGLGIGLLIGSKLSRIILVAAAGAMMNDEVRGQLVRASRQVLRSIEAGSPSEDLEDVEDVEDVPT